MAELYRPTGGGIKGIDAGLESIVAGLKRKKDRELLQEQANITTANQQAELEGSSFAQLGGAPAGPAGTAGEGPATPASAAPDLSALRRENADPFYKRKDVATEKDGFMGFIQSLTNPFTDDRRERMVNENQNRHRQIGDLSKRAAATKLADGRTREDALAKQKFDYDLQLKMAGLKPDGKKFVTAGPGAPYGSYDEATGKFEQLGIQPMPPRSGNGSDPYDRPPTGNAVMSNFRQKITDQIGRRPMFNPTRDDPAEYSARAAAWDQEYKDMSQVSVRAGKILAKLPAKDRTVYAINDAWDEAMNAPADVPPTVIDTSGGTANLVPQSADGKPNLVMRPAGQAPIAITGDADYAALAPGTQYTGPDGKVRVKR